MTDETTPDLPSLEKGPRQPDQQAWTGTGTPRSADQTGAADARVEGDDERIDPAISVGATTSSHPAESTDAPPNRSGSGGSGGPATEDDMRTDGSQPRTMEELLGGDPQGNR